MGKILVADDEKNILDVILEVLEGVGHETIGVSDGLQALAMLERHHFDVALIDVMMPKMDGYHLTEKIRSLSKPPKVVIVTSRDFTKDEKLAKFVGATAFLQKPFSNKELLEVVTNLLAKPTGHSKTKKS